MQIILIYSTIAILVLLKINLMSYCFIFSNIYLKIFFMIKVYGCEKNEDKKTPKIERLLLGKDFAKSSISISTLFFFFIQKIFMFF